MSQIINELRFSDCTCIGINSPHSMCDGEYKLDDKGVKAKLEPIRVDEDVQLIIFDGCICNRNIKKCDALFLYRNNSRKLIFSVELKSSHIEDGIEQLVDTEHTQEYANIKQHFELVSPKVRIIEKKVLVSNTIVSTLDQEKYRKSYNRYFIFIYHNKKTRIPNIRDYLSS